MSLPTLTDLKIHANVTTAADDDELVDMLDAAIAVVEDIAGPIDSAPVTETHYRVCSDMLILKQMPVSELTAISPRAFPGVTTTPFDVADYVLDPATGIVRAGNGAGFYGDYTVTYTAGRDDTPTAIRLACLIIAAHLYETQRMPGQSADSAPAGFGGLDGIPDAGSMSGSGFAIPRRAQELLQPYMRPSIA